MCAKASRLLKLQCAIQPAPIKGVYGKPKHKVTNGEALIILFVIVGCIAGLVYAAFGSSPLVHHVLSNTPFIG